MKKIIIANIAAIFFASIAFAAASGDVTFDTSHMGKTLYGSTGTVGTPGSAGTIVIGKTSTGVSVGWVTGAGGYSVWTQHQNGSKAFGATFDSSYIYQKDVAKGSPVTSPTASDSTAFNGWGTM